MSIKDPFIIVIVVGVDFSALTGLALDQTLEMATLHAGAEVHARACSPRGAGRLDEAMRRRRGGSAYAASSRTAGRFLVRITIPARTAMPTAVAAASARKRPFTLALS
jgi:hypothetical protein